MRVKSFWVYTSILFLSIYFPLNNAHGSGFNLEFRDFNYGKNAGAKNFITSILNRVPKEVSRSLSKTIQIEFKDFGDGENLPKLCADPTLLLQIKSPAVGWVNRSDTKIYIHSLFEKSILAGKSMDCQKIDLYLQAQVGVLHELGHQYDRKVNISQTLRFQALNHFAPSVKWHSYFLTFGLLPRPIKSKNRDQTHSKQPQEFESSSEAFAIQFAQSLLDPEFVCRRPAVTSFFREHFEVLAKEANCGGVATQVPLASRDFFNSSHAIVNLNPNRIWRIDYFFASPAKEMMSRWGHAMFRLVVCDPRRVKPSKDCENDVSFHVVLSFRGDVRDLKIDPVIGILGGNPSKLFVMPLGEVLQEYTVEEFRDLESHPLDLTDNEKGNFIYAALEAIWGYRGNYAFLTNNCAHESAALLTASLLRPSMKLSHGTPLALRRSIRKQNLSANSKEEPLSSKDVYRSKEPIYKLAYDKIVKYQAPSPEYASFKEFIKASSVQSRKIWYENVVSARQDKTEVVRASFFLLERYFLVLVEKEFQDFLAKLAGRASSTIDQTVARLMANLNASDPLESVNRPYGIPLTAELIKDPYFDPKDSAQTASAEGSNREVQASAQSILDELEKAHPGLTEKLQQVNQAVKYYRSSP